MSRPCLPGWIIDLVLFLVNPTGGSLHCTHWRLEFQRDRLRSFILFMGWIAAPGAIRANGTVVKAKAFTGKRR